MNTDEQQAFDAAMRDRYRLAAERVSPRVRWQARPGAGTTQPGRRSGRPGWRAGLAFAGVAAALCAIVVGLPLRAPDATMSTTPAEVATAADVDGDPTVSLDQDPDFYAWLASPDAEQLAME